jgi:26S proteasome regulatory subunit (ATPase 3-interacting protein)
MSKSKETSAVEAVLDYLRTQNRPYSVNDIVQNLHKEHGKAAVQKAVDKLVQV